MGRAAPVLASCRKLQELEVDPRVRGKKFTEPEPWKTRMEGGSLPSTCAIGDRVDQLP